MDLSKYSKYTDLVIENLIIFVPKLLLAGAILLVGLWAVKKINKLAAVSISRLSIPSELASFFSSFLDIVLKAIVVLMAAGRLGFDATSLVAVVAAAGFAVGLALQGFLGNFASGITIIFFKPYKVGDWAEVAGLFGKVEEIQIFNSLLSTPGGKTLIIPNGKVTDGVIKNYSTKGHIHLELKMMIPYSESFPKVKKIIEEALKASQYIVHDLPTKIGIETFDTHNVKIAILPFILPDDFWEATFEINQLLKKAFSENDIQIAYPEEISLGKIGE